MGTQSINPTLLVALSCATTSAGQSRCALDSEHSILSFKPAKSYGLDRPLLAKLECALTHPDQRVVVRNTLLLEGSHAPVLSVHYFWGVQWATRLGEILDIDALSTAAVVFRSSSHEASFAEHPSTVLFA